MTEPAQDLLARTAELVDIFSESHHEQAIADHIESTLSGVSWLDVDRVGANVVARTQLGRRQRVILAGHTDTVPPNGNEHARLDGDVLWGLGAADMKSGVAVFLDLALALADPVVDVTYVFYECEEVASEFNGLSRLFRERPDLLAGDAAVLGEPTSGVVEAGCQGSLRVAVTLAGERAHIARPWMGRNAIHRLGRVLEELASYEERRPVIDGCEFRESLQAVAVEGGVAGNVVPDRATVAVSHRFAPDRAAQEAFSHVVELLGDSVLTELGDEVTQLDLSPAAPPSLDHPLLQSLVARSGAPARAKLGWTDVAFFAAHGVPATNFGPGDPTLAHTRDERVERASIDRVYGVLHALLTDPVAS